MSKIIVAGDSIAYGKWDSEGGWVARLRKYIDETYNIRKINNFQVYNLGIPGEVVPRMADRFEQELPMRIPKEDSDKRALVIFAVGINDSCPNNWMTLKQTPENEFKTTFKKMVEVAIRQDCKVLVVGLTPVNPSRSKGLLFSNEAVTKYDKYLSEICEEMQISKLQLFEDLQENNFSELLVDVVHPNSEGHKILTEKVIDFLKRENLLNYLA